MADKQIKVKVDVETNAEGSIAELKALKKQLKETAAGSEEFKKIFNQIDDLEDKIKGAKKASSDWIDTLESAGGPIGMLGAGLNKLKVSTQSFGAALKATGIGLVVAAVGGLVAAFAETDGAMKKLEPLMISLQKILGGIFEALTPLIDAFVDLATKALPYVTTGIKVFYSSLVAFFTLVKEAGVGVGKILKGIFTLDTDSIKEGWSQLTGSWDKTVQAFEASEVRFDAGYKKRTKIEIENAKKSKEIADKALEEKLKRLEAEDKLDEAKLEKLKAEALALATTEQEKLDVQKKFAELSYNALVKDIEDKQKLYKKDSVEYTTLQADKVKAEADYIEKKIGFSDEQKKIDEKTAEDARGILATELQSKFEALDKKNKLSDLDFEQDLARIQEQKAIIAEQEANELSNTELTEFERTQIRKKYADLRMGLTDLELKTERDAIDAKLAINMAYLGLVSQFGQLLGDIAGKNKDLAIAAVVIQQAASIGQIIASTGAANAKAVLASPLTFGQPWVTINTISAALSVAGSIAAGVKAIQGIKNAASSAGITGGSGGSSGITSAPAIQAPKVGSATAPEIQTGEGINPTTQIAQSINKAQAPLKAYVISGEISSQQALDRRTTRAATFAGG